MKLMILRKFKRKLGKKADAGTGTELPLQAFIEIIILLSIGIAFFVYGSFLLNDFRMYQIFLSKDISLLQNSLVLVDDDVLSVYSPPPNSRLSAFVYRFKPLHTDVIYLDGDQNLDEGVIRSYIHFGFNPPVNVDANPKVLFNPQSIYFYKFGNTYNIGKSFQEVRSNLGSLRACDILELRSDAKFYFDYDEELSIFNTMMLTYFNKPESFWFFPRELRTFERQFQDDFKVYFLLKQNNDDVIRISVPFDGKSAFGCELFNRLQSVEQNIDVIYFPTSSVSKLNKDFNYSTQISIPDGKEGLVFRTIKEIIDFS